MGFAQPISSRRGFTLVELLVVIAIILMVTVAALPVVLPAINQRQVSEAALLLQAELSRARDMAIRDNTPRGIRLLPELDGNNRFYIRGSTPAYSRMIPIENGPDYSEGAVRNFNPIAPVRDDLLPQFSGITGLGNWRIVMEAKAEQITVGGTTVPIPRPPTSWYWNVRQGDKIRFGDSPQVWTIVGPVLEDNPERYVNWGLPSTFNSTPSLAPAASREFLVLVDGQDNDSDGYIDEGFDGVNNDGDVYPPTFPIASLRGQPVTDPGFNGINDNPPDTATDEPAEAFFNGGLEFEIEGVPPIGSTDDTASTYTILRRPVPARGARELTLPSGVVIDMTTWNHPSTSNPARERSRLPVDPPTGYVDIMFAPNGQLVQPLAGPTEPYPPQYPYFHFWLTDTDDVYEPAGVDLDGDGNNDVYLPMPQGTPGYPADLTRFLENNRRLITLNTQSGQVTTTTVEIFDVSDYQPGQPTHNPAALDRPFLQAQSGVKDVQ